MSEFVIGLTIVGFGTSCPELVVSLTGALEGQRTGLKHFQCPVYPGPHGTLPPGLDDRRQ